MRRWLWITAAVGLGMVTALAAFPGNPVGYLARAAVGQADMLWGRIPLDQALDEELFDRERAAKLRLVPQIKQFGRTVGLSHTDNYGLVHPTWDRQIFNVSACAELAFRPKRYWFPIVGSISYIGYFDEALAREQQTKLAEEGYDVYVRTVGAYSTLGWFRDPILPGMLDWSEARFAETLLHELAHATVWVPGESTFNESFANFVGERAAAQWLARRYGETSPEVAAFETGLLDGDRYRALMNGVVDDLEAVYEDPALGDDAKRARKASIFESLATRALAAGFSDPEGWAARFRDPSRWNNARLLQFRTYNRGQNTFAILFQEEGQRLPDFIARIRALTDDADDPWAALAVATGTPLDDDAFER